MSVNQEMILEMWHIYPRIEYYSAKKENEIMNFAGKVPGWNWKRLMWDFSMYTVTTIDK